MRVKEKPAAMGVATGKYKRSSETVYTIIALLAAAVILLWEFWPQETIIVEKTYSVRIGETIWDIANDVKEQGDVRKVNEIMWQIQYDNNIKNAKNIQAGDKIIVWMQLLDKKEGVKISDK